MVKRYPLHKSLSSRGIPDMERLLYPKYTSGEWLWTFPCYKSTQPHQLLRCTLSILLVPFIHPDTHSDHCPRILMMRNKQSIMDSSSLCRGQSHSPMSEPDHCTFPFEFHNVASRRSILLYSQHAIFKNPGSTYIVLSVLIIVGFSSLYIA
ncbi:hypothetical protein F5879DRAFT_957797, partial [Lentinula edodes]